MYTRRVFPTITTVLLLLVFLAVPVSFAEDNPSTDPYEADAFMITEVQTGTPTASDEFIELYNAGDATLPIAGEQYRVVIQPLSGASNSRIIALSNPIEPNSFVLIASTAYSANTAIQSPYTYSAGMSDAGGRVLLQRQLDGEWLAIDSFIWEKDTADFSVRFSASPGSSYKRCTELDESFRNTQQNGVDFYASGAIALHGQFGALCADLLEEDELDDGLPIEEDEDTQAPPLLSCEGVVISEVLPNPAGADGGKEFIELYNPTDDYIDLLGCSLRTSGNAKVYTFTESFELIPGQYSAFYDGVTGLTLPNAAGGTVWLSAVSGGVIDELAYPGNMADDTVWMQFEGVWQLSYAPSPNATNIVMPLRPCAEGQIRNEATGRCINVVTALADLADCGEGRERNPETNRCRNIPTTTLADCGEGRERNPETNRCRNIVTVTTALADCGEGRERNPETNRCRNIASAATALADCGEGRERNPETNRCRNIVASASDIAGVTDVATGQRADMTGWWVAGGVLLLGIGYGVYEWRKDIGRWLAPRLPFRRR